MKGGDSVTPEQIREIVRITLDELTVRKQLNTYSSILQVVGARLDRFFKGAKDSKLSSVLNQLSDDPYIDIIFFQFRDGKTLEWIAEYMERDDRTIKRNKKRLIISLYERLEE